jgi:hypothetical protein
MKTKLFLFTFFSLSFFNIFSQNTKSIEAILPMKDIDQTIDKMYYLPANMGFMAHVDVSASLVNYDDCSDHGQTQGGLKIQIDWYNINDETGKMMADMVKGDISNVMNNFKNSSGFENLSKAVESDIKGGKMWIYTSQKPCVNEITGPTGETEYFTQIRAFVFTGNKLLKIDLMSKSHPSTLEQSLRFFLDQSENFDFSTL